MPHRFRITPVIVLTKHYDMSRTGHATTPFLLFSVYFAVSHFILFKKNPMSIILFVIFLFSGKFREFDYSKVSFYCDSIHLPSVSNPLSQDTVHPEARSVRLPAGFLPQGSPASVPVLSSLFQLPEECR